MKVPPPPEAQGRGRVSIPALFVLLLLLVLPGCALYQSPAQIDRRILFGTPVALSLVTLFLYRSDKRHAEAGEWRFPESTLHFCELIGGWPGAFLAQRWFRHKSSKASYQFTFWFIILIHQFVALDYLWGWKMSRMLFSLGSRAA